jgi:hypothetical protein
MCIHCEGIVTNWPLKELSHEIEMGCWWYGRMEPYLEMNLWKFLQLFIAFWSTFLNFTFLRGVAERLPLCVQLGQPSCKCAIGCWQPYGKFVTGGKRVSATIWQICYRVLEVIGNPLANVSEGIGNFCNSTYLVEGCQHPLLMARGYWLPSREVVKGYWITSKDICKKFAPLPKKRGILFCNTFWRN